MVKNVLGRQYLLCPRRDKDKLYILILGKLLCSLTVLSQNQNQTNAYTLALDVRIQNIEKLHLNQLQVQETCSYMYSVSKVTIHF